MTKYDSYKDSRVEWSEEIPIHWDVVKLKNVTDIKISSVDKHIFENQRKVKVCNYTDVYYNELISNRNELREGSCTEMEFQNFKLFKDDVIITKDSESPMDIGVPSLVIDELENVVCGYHLTIIKPNKTKIIGGFLFRQLQTKRIRSYYEICSNGITRFGLGKSSVLDTPIFVPPLPEQHQIVKYLDEKTTIIDTLIDKTQQKIDTLKELRTSLINKVVTKGIDPNVEMKDSDVVWIGNVPLNWEISKLGYYTTKIGSGSTPRGGSEVYVDEGVTFIRSQNVHFDGLRLDDVSYIDEITHKDMKGSMVFNGDVLLNITGGSIGRCCVVEENCEMNINQHVSIIRVKPKVQNYFLNYILQSELGQIQVRFNLTGGNRDGLTIDGIRNFIIPIPPIDEQYIIVDYLKEQTQLINTSIQKEQLRIDKLKEYRQSLISDVVTGKIKVTDYE